MYKIQICALRAATLILLIGLLLPPVSAQETGDVLLDIPAGAMAGPNFDVDVATEAYINILSEEERERSDAYFEGRYWLILWGFLYGLGIAWLLLGTRLSSRMRNLAERFPAMVPHFGDRPIVLYRTFKPHLCIIPIQCCIEMAPVHAVIFGINMAKPVVGTSQSAYMLRSNSTHQLTPCFI